MDQRVASEVIVKNTIAYAKQILSNTFPNVIDGFKKVQRRIIITQPTDRYFKGQELISNAIRIHPYSDMSIYDTGCRMAESFRYSFPPLYLDGNTGSYSGDNAAHARYTEFKLSDFCKDVFINDINFKTIPTELTEDLSDHEIQYLIPKIPTALLYYNESIGFGYSSLTVPLKFENICDIVIDYVSCEDKNCWDYHRLAKLFVPHLTIHVFLRNKYELIDSYKKGIFDTPIETEGHYQIVSNNTVLIRTISYGNSSKMVRDKITNMLRDKNSWYAKNECDFHALSESKDYADFQISVKRGISVFELIDRLRKLVFLRTSIHPINNYVMNDKMFNLTPPDIIKIWYKERYRSIFSAKKHRQQDLQSQFMRYSTYLIICEHVDEVITILRKDKPEDQVVEDLKQRFELSNRQCKILIESNFQLLMRAKKKELEERIRKIELELKTLNESFIHIDEEIVENIRLLKKKYKTDDTFSSRESNYIGCLLIENHGIIQINSEEEIPEFVRMFSSTIRYFEYTKNMKQMMFIRPNASYTCIQSVPYTTPSKGITPVLKNIYLFVREGNRSIISDNLTIEPNRYIFNYVSKNGYFIKNTGEIFPITTAIIEKKHHNNILYAFDAKDDAEFVVISINESYPTIVRFQCVNVKDKVMLSNDGNTSIVAVVPKGTDSVVVNLPNFVKANLMLITDIEKRVASNKVNDISNRQFKRI